MADPYARLRQRIAADVARAQAGKPPPPPRETTCPCGAFGKGHHGGHDRGEAHRDAKLTGAIVGECRIRFAAGETGGALAAEFGVSYRAMYLAVTGKTWRHVPMVDLSARPDLRAYRGGADWRLVHRVTMPLVVTIRPAVPAPTFGRAFAGGRSLRWPLAVATPNLSRPETPSHV